MTKFCETQFNSCCNSNDFLLPPKHDVGLKMATDGQFFSGWFSLVSDWREEFGCVGEDCICPPLPVLTSLQAHLNVFNVVLQYRSIPLLSIKGHSHATYLAQGQVPRCCMHFNTESHPFWLTRLLWDLSLKHSQAERWRRHKNLTWPVYLKHFYQLPTPNLLGSHDDLNVELQS